MTDDELYNIEKIIDRRYLNGKYEYKIKWEGYPMSQCTWEPVKNLEMAMELVEEYNDNHPIKNEKSKNLLTEITPKSKKKNPNNSFVNRKRESSSRERTKNKKQKIEEEVKIEDTSLVNGKNDVIHIEETLYDKPSNNFEVKDDFKHVLTVKMQQGKLMAVVEKYLENGVTTKIYISSKELRKLNPWILLDFYESKIKFT